MNDNHVYEDPAVTNPITGEQHIVREAINEYVDSARLDILRAIDEQPVTPSGIEDRGLVTRQTASEYLSEFMRCALVDLDRDHRYVLTYGGKFALESVENCLEEITREELAFLSRSPRPFKLLQFLRTGPTEPRELANASPDSPARITIWRVFQAFEDYGWCESRSGKYHLIRDGEDALYAYQDLIERSEQAIAKAPFLQRLSTDLPDFPTHALADADLVFSEAASPGLVVDAALKLCDPRTRRFRIVTSVFQPTLFKAYHKLVKLGVTLEPIVDASVYERISQDENLWYLFDNSEHENYTLTRLEEPLTLGIGLYDDRKVAVGAYNEIGDGNHVAVIISSNDELIEWANKKYKYYRQQSIDPVDPSLANRASNTT
ncbi:transcriptional regulator FilR1 domain-containing protein [Natronorarus salvus]|uniref:transcriptional regulator FilR1 domain-containing protein n=1 Tax=Natronorarus salvus TaxID=3117733 RepID=UPI002F2685BE